MLLFFANCSSNYSKPKDLESEFKDHVAIADSILFDGDYLHPTYAYIHKGKIIGLNFEANPECGNYTRKYLIGRNEEISKTIIEIDFYNEHCGETYDSIYVINPNYDKVITYSKGDESFVSENREFVKKYNIDLNYYREEIKKWHGRDNTGNR